MLVHAIIKKGTKSDPVFMLHARNEKTGLVELIEDCDNLPFLQPYPELYDKDNLAKEGGELVEISMEIL